MGEPGVDEIIEQWRSSARAAGESASMTTDDGGSTWLRRVGGLRIAGTVLALLVFGLIAIPAVFAGTPSAVPESAVQGASASDDVEQAPNADLTTDVEPAPVATDQPLLPPLDKWFAVMESVDLARGNAYQSSDATPLLSAFDPTGPALAREEAIIEALRATHAKAEGWGTRLLSVAPIDVTSTSVRLRVRDQRGAYTLADQEGVRTQVPAAEPAGWIVMLANHEGRWLLVDVAPEVTNPSEQP